MILELHRQGLKVSAIAPSARHRPQDGPPIHRPWPGATGLRTSAGSAEEHRSIPTLSAGAPGGLSWPRPCGCVASCVSEAMAAVTAVKRAVRDIRPEPIKPFEVRFETPPGEQAQVDLARFELAFTDEPGVTRIVWLFSMVLGFSRLIWARFVAHQDHRPSCAATSPPWRRSAARARDPLRSHEDRGDRRGCRRAGRLQSQSGRPCSALRLPAARLPAISATDEGQGGAAVPLHSRGLLPGRRVPQPRRPQCPAPPLARDGRQCPVHATTQRVVKEAFAEEADPQAVAVRPLPGGPQARTARLPRGHGERRRQPLQCAGHHAPAHPGRPRLCRRDPHLRERRCDRQPSTPRRPRPDAHRSGSSEDRGAPRCRPANGAPIVIRRAGDQVARRSLDFYQAVAQRIAGQRGAP